MFVCVSVPKALTSGMIQTHMIGEVSSTPISYMATLLYRKTPIRYVISCLSARHHLHNLFCEMVLLSQCVGSSKEKTGVITKL